MTQKLRTPRTENAAILFSTKHSWSFTTKWQKMGTFKNHLKENVSLHLLQPFRRMLQLFFFVVVVVKLQKCLVVQNICMEVS